MLIADDERPMGPTGIARAAEEEIARLEAEAAGATPRQRRVIAKNLYKWRYVLRACKSTVGYRPEK